MATKKTKETASVLAFARKLDPSDALLFSGNWDERDASDAWIPIPIREHAGRGTFTHRISGNWDDQGSLESDPRTANPYTADAATLPSDADTLKVMFTLRVLAGAGEPSACNDGRVLQGVQDLVKDYLDVNGFQVLAKRYAFNLANARFLWRNRPGAETVQVCVDHWVEGVSKKCWTFDSLTFSLYSFEVPEASREALEELAALIAEGLHGREHVLLRITAFSRLGAGQWVHPSQEMVLGRKRGDKGKMLYQVQGVASMHAQKLGNAIRTIDTWYPTSAAHGPIAVEPYGAVTTRAETYRKPTDKVDFYTLFDHWVLKGGAPDEGNQHFVMAMLIRGGVFGEQA